MDNKETTWQNFQEAMDRRKDAWAALGPHSEHPAEALEAWDAADKAAEEAAAAHAAAGGVDQRPLPVLPLDKGSSWHPGPIRRF